MSALQSLKVIKEILRTYTNLTPFCPRLWTSLVQFPIASLLRPVPEPANWSLSPQPSGLRSVLQPAARVSPFKPSSQLASSSVVLRYHSEEKPKRMLDPHLATCLTSSPTLPSSLSVLHRSPLPGGFCTCHFLCWNVLLSFLLCICSFVTLWDSLPLLRCSLSKPVFFGSEHVPSPDVFIHLIGYCHLPSLGKRPFVPATSPMTVTVSCM